MLRLRWDNGEETTIVPGPGVLSVVAGRPKRATRARGGGAGATSRSGVKKTSSPSTTAKRTAPAKKSTSARKAAVKKMVGKATPPVEQNTKSTTTRDRGAKASKDEKRSDRKTSGTAKSKDKKNKAGKKKR